MEFFAEQLIKVRKKSGLKVGSITGRLGVGRSTYWNWEHGKTIPAEKDVRNLANIFNIDVTMISDLTSTNDRVHNNLFNNETDDSYFSSGRGDELINRQNYAISLLKDTNSELNKVWAIVSAIMKAVDVILYIKAVDCKYIIANRAFKKNLLLTGSYKVAGKRDSEFFSAREADFNEKEDFEVINTGNSILHKEGMIPGARRRKWGLYSKFPVHDSKGKIAGMIGIFDDITEKRKMQWMSELIEFSLGEATDIYTIREVGSSKYLYLSKSITKNLGYDVKIFLKENGYEKWLNIIHPKDRPAESKYNEKLEYPEIRTCRILSADGSLQWYEVASHKISYGNKEYLCCEGRNITRLKSAMRANDELHNIINSLNNFLVWKGVVRHGLIIPVYISENFRKITGYSKTDFVNGKIKVLDIVPEAQRNIFSKWSQNNYDAIDVEHQIICKSGKRIWVETRTFSQIDTNGEIEVILTHQDITERKELEFELRRFQKVAIKQKTKLRLKSRFEENLTPEEKTSNLADKILRIIEEF